MKQPGGLTLEAPCDGRLSRTVLGEVWGEIPLTYSTNQKLKDSNNESTPKSILGKYRD